MTLFTVGPLEIEEEIRAIASEPIPYFRNSEFSALMLKIEAEMKQVMFTTPESRLLTFTASGTAAMEACVINLFNARNKVLVVSGGGFGERFVELCELHNLPHDVLFLEYGKALTEQALDAYDLTQYDGLFINGHETTTGSLYDLKMVGQRCKESDTLLIVDAISTFLCDEYRMADWGINVSIFSSQKALALPPGLSFVMLDEKAKRRLISSQNLYMNFERYLKNMEHGQTPFTPAVSIIYQLARRLEGLLAIGVDAYVERSALLAAHFRNNIGHLPITCFSENKSNCLTSLEFFDADPIAVYEVLVTQYNLTTLPCGGDLAHKLLRVGHIGHLSFSDNMNLISALEDVVGRV